MNSRYPLPASPNGWFSIGATEDLAPGDVRPVHYLGRDLVLFRGDDGAARAFDAHCPHLGAHLGVGGRVCGDGIACPFHGWRFDGQGELVEVPGLDRPPRAGARAWDVCERNGRIFVWNHADDEPPSFDVIGYREDVSAWTAWRSSSYQVRVHVQDLTENIIDRSHFSSVHDMAAPDREHFEVRFSGPSMIVEQSLKVTAVSASGIEVKTTSTTCGPGIVAVEVDQDRIEMLTYITQTPIDDELTEIGLHFSMKRLPDLAATESISELNDQVTNLQFTQDVPIWENKIYRERPILTKVDGPVSQYRRWFRQFYPDGNGSDPG
jgi:phenylpropionate dioxygenase-like ring-hydroxylating dioxygenase large terminal subunit